MTKRWRAGPELSVLRMACRRDADGGVTATLAQAV